MAERLNPREFNHSLEVVLRHIERYLKAVKLLNITPKNTDIWLNYGCGHTYTSELLSSFAGHIVAYDRDNEVYGKSDERISYTAPKIDKTKFNAIFLIEVFEHLTFREGFRLLKLLKAIKKTDGYLMLSTPLVPQTNFKPTNPHHKVEYSLQDICLIFDKAGLIVAESDISTVTFTDKETKQQGIFKLI